jgi:hypothetical protein
MREASKILEKDRQSLENREVFGRMQRNAQVDS